MSGDRDLEGVINNYGSESFSNIDIFSIHTGRVSFKIAEGEAVVAPSGEWQQIPGSQLYEINRERNPKIITARINGKVTTLHAEFDGQFVEAGENLMTIKHPLSKREIIENIIKDELSLFPAPQTAKYFFPMEIQARIEKNGMRYVTIEPGDEILVMSLMKRDIPIYYKGERGVIYSLYFKPGITIAQGAPLLGVCVPEKLPLIQEIITRVEVQWHSNH